MSRNLADVSIEFVTSAPSHEKLPETNGEIALWGRSNVGKSSLLNALANRTGLAHVSKTPGRTQLLNLFSITNNSTQETRGIVDLPGYGFANVPVSVKATWEEMTNRYIVERKELLCVWLLIDSEVGPTKNDLVTIEWLKHFEVPFELLATKTDKVKSAKRSKRRQELITKCGVNPTDVRWTSATKNVNIVETKSRLAEQLFGDIA